MVRLLAGKAGQYGLVLLLIVLVNFALPRLAPGDPLAYVVGPQEASMLAPAEREQALARFDLDGSLPDQLWSYLSGVATLDLGSSLRFGAPVAQVLSERLPWTLLLVGGATVLSGTIAVAAALASARRGGRGDADILAGVLTLESMPPFWLGMILLAVFSVELDLLPAFGATAVEGGVLGLDVAEHLVLPLTTLTLATTASVFLIARSSLLSELSAGYVRFARAKGVPEPRIMRRHVLRNALLPIVTVLLANLGMVLGGAVVIETVFSYPGLGSAIYEAVLARDYPLLQGTLLLAGAGVVAANAVADALYVAIDPRVRHGGVAG